ncbi:MAG: serine/threonine protein kinase [Deltaproteobacteria bacterium]|nr:serine/threonine protein kinase [Deltaproteobacteria bacterium]
MSNAEPVVGDQVGTYVLESLLGEGGMGRVFLARHSRLTNKRVAVKFIAQRWLHDPEAGSRFLHESKIVSALDHPNIVRILDLLQTEEPPRLGFVMELLEGPTLSRMIATGAIEQIRALDFATQIARALTEVNRVGVIHRDIKPANIVVTRPECESPVLKLLDFGVAKIPMDGLMHRTRTGVILGTPVYMAPEQLAGDSVSHRTDVYAVGQILYEMLTARKLFGGDVAELLRDKLLPKVPQSPQVPLSIHRLVERCVDSDPKGRMDAEELVSELEGARAALCRQSSSPEPSDAPTVALGEAPLPSYLAGGRHIVDARGRIEYVGQTEVIRKKVYVEKPADHSDGPLELNAIPKRRASNIAEQPPDDRALSSELRLAVKIAAIVIGLGIIRHIFLRLDWFTR